jgi:hypothetical protein
MFLFRLGEIMIDFIQDNGTKCDHNARYVDNIELIFKKKSTLAVSRRRCTDGNERFARAEMYEGKTYLVKNVASPSNTLSTMNTVAVECRSTQYFDAMPRTLTRHQDNIIKTVTGVFSEKVLSEVHGFSMRHDTDTMEKTWLTRSLSWLLWALRAMDLGAPLYTGIKPNEAQQILMIPYRVRILWYQIQLPQIRTAILPR